MDIYSVDIVHMLDMPYTSRTLQVWYDEFVSRQTDDRKFRHDIDNTQNIAYIDHIEAPQYHFHYGNVHSVRCRQFEFLES